MCLARSPSPARANEAAADLRSRLGHLAGDRPAVDDKGSREWDAMGPLARRPLAHLLARRVAPYSDLVLFFPLAMPSLVRAAWRSRGRTSAGWGPFREHDDADRRPTQGQTGDGKEPAVADEVPKPGMQYDMDTWATRPRACARPNRRDVPKTALAARPNRARRYGLLDPVFSAVRCTRRRSGIKRSSTFSVKSRRDRDHFEA